MNSKNQPIEARTPKTGRIASVDVLRGLVMVTMAIDHSRDFFTNLPFEPEDLAHTYPSLFLTRWITHFCAPLFFFLAGTGAFFYATRTGSAASASRFLWTRGLWLMFLEFTIIGLAWTFVFPWGMAGVIWSLGCSMVLLALIIRLPVRWIAALSVFTIVLHDVFDSVSPKNLGAAAWLWSLLHSKGMAMLPLIHQPVFVLFPIVPWMAVMAAGYAFGCILLKPPAERRRWVIWAGLAMTLLFLVLRAGNFYGNPHLTQRGGVSPGDWHEQSSIAMSVVSFLDVEKYPPSLQFILMTLGPSLLLLAWFDRVTEGGSVPSWLHPLLVFGRVPMFFYVLHLYLIHLLAVLVAVLFHQPFAWLLHGGFFFNDLPDGYGHGLPFIYMMWAIVLLVLYFPCKWFAELKRRRTDWWLSYL